jgi:hypothetical protein
MRENSPHPTPSSFAIFQFFWDRQLGTGPSQKALWTTSLKNTTKEGREMVFRAAFDQDLDQRVVCEGTR